MTNEEAIRILETMESEMLLTFYHDRKEALKLAISALKKLPSVVEIDTTNIGDTINNKQPELKVPISWIKENIHSLKAMENTRTFLTEMDVPTLINRLEEKCSE